MSSIHAVSNARGQSAASRMSDPYQREQEVSPDSSVVNVPHKPNVNWKNTARGLSPVLYLPTKRLILSFSSTLPSLAEGVGTGKKNFED